MGGERTDIMWWNDRQKRKPNKIKKKIVGKYQKFKSQAQIISVFSKFNFWKLMSFNFTLMPLLLLIFDAFRDRKSEERENKILVYMELN